MMQEEFKALVQLLDFKTQEECVEKFLKLKALIKLWNTKNIWIRMDRGYGMAGEPENHYFVDWYDPDTEPEVQRRAFYSIDELAELVNEKLTEFAMKGF